LQTVIILQSRDTMLEQDECVAEGPIALRIANALQSLSGGGCWGALRTLQPPIRGAYNEGVAVSDKAGDGQAAGRTT
jgi:hypothetical protein